MRGTEGITAGPRFTSRGSMEWGRAGGRRTWGPPPAVGR